MSLLGISIDYRCKRCSQKLELFLGLRIEKWQRSEVYSLGRVLLVDDDRGTDGRCLATTADAYAAEEVLSMA